MSQETIVCKRKIIQRDIKRKPTVIEGLTRKRKKNESVWIDNAAKKARAEGKKGFGRKGPIKEKNIRPECIEQCKSKCSEKISEEERQTAFNDFYTLGNSTKQWQCIANWVSQKNVKQPTDEERELAQIYKKNKNLRTFNEYTLPTANGPVVVCRNVSRYSR